MYNEDYYDSYSEGFYDGYYQAYYEKEYEKEMEIYYRNEDDYDVFYESSLIAERDFATRYENLCASAMGK